MKSLYFKISLLFLISIFTINAQTFDFSIEFIGTNSATNNYQFALVATPSAMITNGVTADIGAGFYVPTGLTIGNFENGNSNIPASDWTSTFLDSNATGDAYFISRVEAGSSSTNLNGIDAFQLVIFDVIANPNPSSGNIIFVENGDPVFDVLFVENYININLGNGTTNAYNQNNPASNSYDFSGLDNEAPIAIAQNIDAFLNSSGEVTVNALDVDNGSTDNVGIASYSLDVDFFTCDDIGDFITTFTVTDTSGNTDSVDVTISIIDDISPALSVQNITVALGSDGTVTVDPFEPVIDSGDNCILDVFLDNAFFTCDDIGDNIVAVSAQDGSGNITEALITITAIDNIEPTAIGQDVTVQLSGGTATISPSDIDDGSFDNCNFTLSLDIDTFTATGVYPVFLTITDSSGNTDTTEVTVTVEESLGVESVVFSDNQIRIFPIPVNDILSYKTEFSIDQFIIYDVTGKTIKRVETPNGNIRVSHLEDGVYFIKFKSSNRYVTKRFVKQ